MDSTAIEERFSRLEQENAELKREIQLLRGVPEAKQDAREGELLPRRDLLKGAAYVMGAVSLSLMGTQRAEAATGYFVYGSTNQASTSTTYFQSLSPSSTLELSNALSNQDDPSTGIALNVWSNSGHAIFARVWGTGSHGNGVDVAVAGTGHGVLVDKPNEFGHGVLAYQEHPASFYAAIAGVTSGAGPGLHGRGEGTGQGVWGEINDSSKTQAAVIGTNEGTGPAIEGRSVRGRGGVFTGKKAQVRLIPSAATTKPSTGSRGDLFVDSSGRLWYCKTGGATNGWVQLA